MGFVSVTECYFFFFFFFQTWALKFRNVFEVWLYFIKSVFMEGVNLSQGRSYDSLIVKLYILWKTKQNCKIKN